MAYGAPVLGLSAPPALHLPPAYLAAGATQSVSDDDEEDEGNDSDVVDGDGAKVVDDDHQRQGEEGAMRVFSYLEI